MLARLLNAMMGPKEEGAVRDPEIDGSKLPEFDLVKKYLGPRRSRRPKARTTAGGS